MMPAAVQSAAPMVPPAPLTPQQELARKAAEEFEAVFMGQAMQSLFAGIETDGAFGGGHSEQVFRSVLIGEYARSAAKAGGVGLAESVYREILKHQEAIQP